MRVEAKLRIVHVNRLDLGQADRLIQLAHHTVVVVHQIVAGIQHMAGVERDADVRLVLHAVHDRGELLEVAPAFRAFAGHGLQQHHNAIRTLKHLIQPLANQPAAGLGALAHMRAGMNVDIHLLAGLADGGQQLDILGQRLDGKCALGLILAGQIVDVRRMDDQRPIAFGPELCAEHRRAGQVERLGTFAIRRSRKERERGAALLMGAFQQLVPAASRRQMRSDKQTRHFTSAFREPFHLPLSYGRQHRVQPAQPT